MRPDREFLEEALKDLHKGETIERALGRILRRHGRPYREYVRLIGEIRDFAEGEKISAMEAARRLAQA